MTVTYTAQVATSSVGCFLKLLFRWRGSLYKLLWREFVIFVASYFCLSFAYRFIMDEQKKRIFELVARYCEAYNNLIPVAFVLGFYVAIVVERWNLQYMSVPWPDRLALFVTASVKGADDRGRLMRRTIMRYICLSYVIIMTSISPPVKKRFPSFAHITDAGFLLIGEEQILIGIKTPHNKYFIPLVWATSLVARARKEGRIRDDFAVKTIIDEINQFRGMLGNLLNYDTTSVPLVYTQVVTLAVYMFFLSCLMGRQFLQKGRVGDVYVPIFTLLQFFFYMGWLKVAETLMNPFGEDDDDFDINAMIDRNLQVSYLIVDEMHADHPQLIKDQYWDEIEFDLPYTAVTEQYRQPPRIGSTHQSVHSIHNGAHDFGGPYAHPIHEQRNDVKTRSYTSEVSINTYAVGDNKRVDIAEPDFSKNTEHFQVPRTKPECPAYYSAEGGVNFTQQSYKEFSDVDSDNEMQITVSSSVRNRQQHMGTTTKPRTDNWHEEGSTAISGCPPDIPDWTRPPCVPPPDSRAYMVTIADYSDRYDSDHIAITAQAASLPRTASCVDMGHGRPYSISQPQRLHRSTSFQHNSLNPSHM